MATKAPRKRRTKKLQINVTHALFGLGALVERRATQTGNDILVVRFPDETRSLLASSQYWLSLPDTGKIAVSQEAVPDEPDDEPELADVEGDAEELVIQ
jgi:hypothetical protein